MILIIKAAVLVIFYLSSIHYLEMLTLYENEVKKINLKQILHLIIFFPFFFFLNKRKDYGQEIQLALSVVLLITSLLKS